MSLGRRVAFAVIANWANRFITIGLGLVFTRILFARMGSEEQGLWLLLGNSTAFLALLDLGLGPTLTRHIALAKGRSGVDGQHALNPDSLSEIADLLSSGIRLYRILSVVVFLVSWGIGLLFLSRLHYEQVSPGQARLAWTILCAGYALGIWAQVWPCLLNGLGLVGWNTLVATVVSILTVVAQLVVVLRGGGLLAMAIVSVIGGFLSRQTGVMLARRMNPELFRLRGRWNPVAVRSMVSPALRAWFTGLGAFLILQTDQYFISYFMGISHLRVYQAAYQIPANIYILAVSFAGSSSVYVSHLWQAGELDQVHALVKRSLRLGMLIMFCGVACLVVSGRSLIDLWLGPGHFVGYPVLLTFCAMLTLEAHHVIIVSCSRATEDEAFAVWALGAGVLNLIFTYSLIGPLGLWGVALGTFCAQLLTNNWYAVYRGLRRLKLSIREHVTDVLVPVTVTFAGALAAAWAAAAAARSTGSELLTLAAVIAATGSVLLAALWLQVLDKSERTRILGLLTPQPR